MYRLYSPQTCYGIRKNSAQAYYEFVPKQVVTIIISYINI